MRSYAKVAPQFWTGETGSQLRALGPPFQVLALYFLTCPSANMVGIYYVPVPTISYEIGLPPDVVVEGLRHLRELGFAYYDLSSHFVFVPEMARFQVGERLSLKDNQRVAVLRTLATVGHREFAELFLDRYRDRYHLEAPVYPKGPSHERIPRPITEAIFERDGGQCVACSARQALQIDHILAKILGGKTEVGNLQVLCASCNVKKSAQDRAVFWERHAGLCCEEARGSPARKSDSASYGLLVDQSPTGQIPIVDGYKTGRQPVSDESVTGKEGSLKGIYSGSGTGTGTGSGSGAVPDRSRRGPTPSDRKSDSEDENRRKGVVPGIKAVLSREQEVRLERICRSLEAKANGDPRAGGFRGEVCAARLLNSGMGGADVLTILLTVLDSWDETPDPWAFVHRMLQEDYPEIDFQEGSEVPGEQPERIGTFTSLGSVLDVMGVGKKGTAERRER